MIRDTIMFELLELRLVAKVGKLPNLGWKTAAGKNILILETLHISLKWLLKARKVGWNKNVLILETAS